MMKVLLIEDNQALCRSLKEFFKVSGIDCETAADGSEGLYLASGGSFDVIALDIALPQKSGTEVLSSLRKGKVCTPVLMLTAKDSIEDKEAAFGLGADDYLVKPFSHKELLMRVKALARRPRELYETSYLQIGNTRVDIYSHQVEVDGKPAGISAKEAKLLAFLFKHRERYVSKEIILNAVWGINRPLQTNNVEVYIHMLRKNLPSDRSGFVIDTKHGYGYRAMEAPRNV